MPPAWTLRAWPPVYRTAQPPPGRFEHAATHLFDDDPHHGVPSGQTMWVCPSREGEVGVAWDWVQVSHGVVSMLDPMGVLTNMKLLGSSGEVLTAWQAARHLNEIVFTLPWQREVARVIGQRKRPTSRAGDAPMRAPPRLAARTWVLPDRPQ